jgi:hypothetical protein
MQQSSNHTFVGLQQDTAVSKQSPEYLIDAHNIRITARGNETLLTITNEKGPKELALVNTEGAKTYITGTILGHCVLNNYLVLFTHEASYGDKILRIDMSKNNPEVVSMFQSEDNQSLGFSEDYPIEAIGDYENENIQKVYWIDGLNQPRIINIIHPVYTWNGAFNFVPELQLNETISVNRIASSGGQFPSGVIQYAFTYYNKYGQETNIFHTTPLLYTSFNDRGGSPETSVSNAFNIEISGIDSHFDYLRIYSIIRTTLNAVPTCKRVQDIDLSTVGNTIKFIDTGTVGDTVDSTSLLYIGGEDIIPNSICAKDGTLFLGNIKINRPAITSIKDFASNIRDKSVNKNASTVIKEVNLTRGTTEGYIYSNGLNAEYNGYSTNAAGFKNREYYRLGIQAQYKDGKWSEPVWIGDYQVKAGNNAPTQTNYILSKLTIEYTLNKERLQELKRAGYKKVRPLVVFPEIQDRTVLCQGIINPTMYTTKKRESSIQAQSSWFFRPFIYGVDSLDDYTSNGNAYSSTTCSPFSVHDSVLPYTNNSLTWNPTYIRGVEFQGQYETENKFKVDWSFLTLHSPDLEFEDSLYNTDLTNVKCRQIGVAPITYTASDINIQTSTPTISNSGSGFTHQSFTQNNSKGIISGLFYDDFVVDDYDNGAKFRAYNKEYSPYKWLVYLWNRTGSLNNDVTRPADGGNRSAELSKKTISNLRYSNTSVWYNATSELSLASNCVPQVFSSNEVSIVKLGSNIYEGNIDALITPDKVDGDYFAFASSSINASNVTTSFGSVAWWKTWSKQDDSSDAQGLYQRSTKNGTTQFFRMDGNIADYTVALAVKKESVRVKYKSTPHIVLKLSSAIDNTSDSRYTSTLPIVELYRDYNEDTMFGGTSQDALKANMWIPAGEAISVDSNKALVFEWGDTWYSRYDCLKTYPFTTEDTNKVVEIGSFMLETRVNIDGRYDRNRGQVNNLNMSPTNFNLLNPVYSQRNNFFNYSILDDSYYTLNDFPNQITWSTEKTQGVDVDPWTSITLASTYDMDGSKGKIRALKTWNDNIYCFQDSGICNIIFNARVQIPTSDGVPIEISNNYKVEGKRYISDGVGCINKYAICTTPAALYFIDSIGGHLQAINGNGLSDISSQRSMITWLNKQDSNLWKPNDYTIKLFYDKNHNDLYIVTKNESLCYSEALSQFTSFMSYSEIPTMFNVVDKFYCIKDNYLNEMFEGDYNYFFGEYQGYDISFISNGRSSQQDLSGIDKIYTNVFFRADKWSDKLDSILSSESPFDYIRVWDEYQDTGETLLKSPLLKKKFRVWRAQIPRDAHNRRDRIRNTWCKVTLGSAPRYNNGNNGFIQLHDVEVQYFI